MSSGSHLYWDASSSALFTDFFDHNIAKHWLKYDKYIAYLLYDMFNNS